MKFKDVSQDEWEQWQDHLLDTQSIHNELKKKLQAADWDYSVFTVEDVQQLYSLMVHYSALANLYIAEITEQRLK